MYLSVLAFGVSDTLSTVIVSPPDGTHIQGKTIQVCAEFISNATVDAPSTIWIYGDGQIQAYGYAFMADAITCIDFKSNVKGAHEFYSVVSDGVNTFTSEIVTIYR